MRNHEGKVIGDSKLPIKGCEKYNCNGEFFLQKEKEPNKYVCGKCGKEIEMLIE